MRCPSCEQENDDSNAFCIFCGAALTAEPPEEEGLGQELEAEAAPDELSIAALRDRMRDLQQDIREIQLALEREGIRISRAEPPRERPPVRPIASCEPALASRVTSSAAPPASRPPEDAAYPEDTPIWRRPIQVDWEVVLGGNWIARIGVLALVIGTGFFLKLAFDNDWIGETGRVVLGIAAGLVFLGGGEWWRKKYPVYAQALVGGGVAILYLSIFAAFAMFGLISLYPGVGLLLLVSVASAALALRYESAALAVIGIFGAFGGPFVMGGFAQGTGTDEVASVGPSAQLMAYVIAVDLGVLALSTFRNWRWFTLLALLGSLASFVAWYGSYSDEISLLSAQGSLTIIFLIFVAGTTLFHIVWRRAPEAFDQSLMVINVAAYLGISYGLLWDDFRLWMGGFTLLLSLFYGGIAYAALVKSREHVYLSFMALGIALVLVTVAVPIQLGGPWVSVAWAAEGAVLIWLSFTLRMWQMRVFGVGVFSVFAAWLLILDTPEALSADLTPFANKYLPAYLAGIAATYLAAYLLRRYRDDLDEKEEVLFPTFLVAGNLILTLAVPVQVNGAWIAVAWAVEALALIWLSLRLGLYELRLFSLGVFATLAVRLLVFDTPVVLRDFRLILNHRTLAFASGIVAMYLAALLISKKRESVTDSEIKAILPGLLVGANFLTLWVLSAELISAVDAGIVDVVGRTADHVKSLGLSLLWAVYASILLVAGIVVRSPLVRQASLGLLSIPILKLFLVDSFALERGFRIAAFMGLGGILLMGGFLYQRFSTAITGFLLEDQET